MKAVAALTWLVVISACERSPSKLDQPTEPARPSTTEADRVMADVRAGMVAFLAYGEKVFATLRAHGKDCDVAAKHLEERVSEFRDLGPRMMKVKETMQSLPEADRELIKAESERIMQAFQKSYPDAEALDVLAKECEKTSVAFASVAPKVMFTRKK
jgi:hypothetical protein